jgi:hypothetical protein
MPFGATGTVEDAMRSNFDINHLIERYRERFAGGVSAVRAMQAR